MVHILVTEYGLSPLYIPRYMRDRKSRIGRNDFGGTTPPPSCHVCKLRVWHRSVQTSIFTQVEANGFSAVIRKMQADEHMVHRVFFFFFFAFFSFFVDSFVVFKETTPCVPTATFSSPTSTSQRFLLQDSWRSAPLRHITSLIVLLYSPELHESPPPLPLNPVLYFRWSLSTSRRPRFSAAASSGRMTRLSGRWRQR